MHARTPRARGFTLIELLVGMGLAALVIALIASTMLSQLSAYRQHVNLRTAQANARQGIGFVQAAVRTAGYGVDPDRAIIAYDSFNADSPLAGGVAGYPDAFVTHARARNFSRTLKTASDTQITFEPALSQPMRKGQILLVLCSDASDWAYVTVGSTTDAGETTIPLSGAAGADSPVTLPGPRFHEQAKLKNVACFGMEPVVVEVERKAFFVASYDDDSDAVSPRQPYLMLHEGLDLNDDGRVDLADATPLAPYVEQLQVAYILNTRNEAPPTIVGVRVDTQDVPWGDAWANDATVKPVMSDEYWADSRLGSHPANIRQLRLTIVTRGATAGSGSGASDLYDPDAENAEGAPLSDAQVPWRQLENLGEPATVSPVTLNFPRRVLRLSLMPKNLLMRSQFLPPNEEEAGVYHGG